MANTATTATMTREGMFAKPVTRLRKDQSTGFAALGQSASILHVDANTADGNSGARKAAAAESRPTATKAVKRRAGEATAAAVLHARAVAKKTTAYPKIMPVSAPICTTHSDSYGLAPARANSSSNKPDAAAKNNAKAMDERGDVNMRFNEAVKKYRRLQILIVLGSTRPHPLSVIARYRPF